MFELPEIVNLAKQVNQTLTGKTIANGSLGNSPHKFVWYNRSHEEFAKLVKSKTIGEARTKGRWLFICLDPGYVLLFGEFGGRLLLNAKGEPTPKKYHIMLEFEDGTFLTAMTQMWGAFELYEVGKEQERQYVKGMKPTPIEPEFTYEYFSNLIDTLLLGEKRSVKSLLTQDQIIPGLGNAIAQDILYRARLHPKHSITELNPDQRQELYHAILDTVNQVIDRGGRNDEYDLFNQPGKYLRIMDSQAAGQSCPRCRSKIEKIQYLGGSCYFCSKCQV